VWVGSEFVVWDLPVLDFGLGVLIGRNRVVEYDAMEKRKGERYAGCGCGVSCEVEVASHLLY
jgi:hypothetical protein